MEPSYFEGAYPMDNEILNNEEEETNILTLTDENGVETDF